MVVYTICGYDNHLSTIIYKYIHGIVWAEPELISVLQTKHAVFLQCSCPHWSLAKTCNVHADPCGEQWTLPSIVHYVL